MRNPCILRSVLIAALAALALPAAAWAGPTLIDDPHLADAIPPEVQAYFAAREAEYEQWLATQESAMSASGRSARRIIENAHRCLGTTSHRQLRNDYCVPATTTIIDHFLRGADNHWTQNQWAAYSYSGVPLWTDARGGNMWVMAAGLKAKTGRGYDYTSGNTKANVYNRTEYSILGKSRPVAYGVRILQSDWPYYRKNHDGHIMCGRGFDWRFGTIYVDDPYPENAAPPLGYGGEGGDTYGHKTYRKEVVAGGVVASASQQVVY